MSDATSPTDCERGRLRAGGKNGYDAGGSSGDEEAESHECAHIEYDIFPSPPRSTSPTAETERPS